MMSSDVWIEKATVSPPAEVAIPSPPAAELAPSGYFPWKYLMGRAIAAALFVPLSVVTLAAIVAVRLTSRGPGIYRQKRVGLNGREFTMYKIRTMRHDAEADTGAVWAQRRDPRITRLGRIIRGLHIDEFPQLINVIRGDMTLVGPRPERPEITKMLEEKIPDYQNRLLVLPGITGLAQVNLPPDSDVNDVRRKLVLDRQYIQQASIALDARILLCTALRLIGLRGAVARWLTGVSRELTNCGGHHRVSSRAARPRQPR